MVETILTKAIANSIKKIQDSDNYIVVLKGIPLNCVDRNYKKAYIEDIARDKFGYFMNEIINKRRYISYEEFIILNSFILDQYSNVYIINNNIYMNQYPIDALMNENTKIGLLVHFSESEDEYDETYIGNIDEIIELYNGVSNYNGYLIGAYCEDRIPISNKITKINLFENVDVPLKRCDDVNNMPVVELENESDYIDLIKTVFNEPDEIYIDFTNYTGDTENLISHMQILNSNWKDYTELIIVQRQVTSSGFEHREEYNDILKKYWGYDSFLNIEIYNRQKLDDGVKETTLISQEQIINDLVTQAENCMDPDLNYRDIFVTAPTGAGKSAMFQVPAIYLAEKYNMLTLVISPLIGLMNDQVSNLEKMNYKGAKTINSDISPILKQEILEGVSNGEIDILYLSPESLLARSDIEQLIGDRTIGMIIIDEAHIVTTWGKQFRPDYWYLGEHIRKLRTNQKKKKNQSFVIGTFTATAIYRGVEDMYEETRNSLHLVNPITYLGYIKRQDINIVIDKTKKEENVRREYEKDKFDKIIELIKRAKITNKKTLVYFPTVKLIDDCKQYLFSNKMVSNVTIYHGQLQKEQKDENYQKFRNGEKLVMLATKAFGMGIDINDIQIVSHFAPTGNVCDYVQEIGRAARKKELEGEAYYYYNTRDFKYINRLHGLSTIKKYHIIDVLNKIYELYDLNRDKNKEFTKKRNAMLVDAENFSYIFSNPLNGNEDGINRVKTALLIIQKDFEARFGYSPITVRPIPLFSTGYFAISPNVQRSLNVRFPESVSEIYPKLHICKVNLQKIWSHVGKEVSFPQFKYLIYSKSNELEFNRDYPMESAFYVKVDLNNNHRSNFKSTWNVIKKLAQDSIVSQKYIGQDEFIEQLVKQTKCTKYKATSICEVIFASMDAYRKRFSATAQSILQKKETNDHNVKYQFKTAIESYFSWVEKNYDKIISRIDNNHLYVINKYEKQAKETNTILGILEALDVLTFEMSGGDNSQLYIYINQIRVILNIISNPSYYDNRLLNMVEERRLISVEMLSYIYESGFTSDEIWDILEDYFLGIIPIEVKKRCLKENPNINFGE